MIRSVGRRLRRNYGWIFAILGAAYFAKIAIHPTDVDNFAHFVRRAHIGPIPGWSAPISGVAFYIGRSTLVWITGWSERSVKSTLAILLRDRYVAMFGPARSAV